jgi:hypothetical protein
MSMLTVTPFVQSDEHLSEGMPRATFFESYASDEQAHREDRFIAGYLAMLGQRSFSVRELAKRLAQEALDEVIDTEGRIDALACATLDVSRLFSRCSTLSAHGKSSFPERQLILDTFAKYVRGTPRQSSCEPVKRWVRQRLAA